MLNIPDAVLRNRTTGFDVRLRSRTRRERLLHVTGAMIAQQLRAVDSLRSSVR
jgi:hypothetical protein